MFFFSEAVCDLRNKSKKHQQRPMRKWVLGRSASGSLPRLVVKAKLPARCGLQAIFFPQDPSGGQFVFFLSLPFWQARRIKPPSLRRKPQSSGAFEGGRSVVLGSSFRRSDGRWGVAAVCLCLVLTMHNANPAFLQKPNRPPDGPCGMKTAYKPRLAGRWAFCCVLRCTIP